MDSVNDINQIENICLDLLKGFIGWIKINDKEERAAILDSAYDFKYSIATKNKVTLQGKYFTSNISLTTEEHLLLLNQWKVTFVQLINSKLDRTLKDSFKLWFLSLASSRSTNLKNDASILWNELLEGIDHCKKFSIKDIPHPYNTITKN